ncbi:MAG: TetR/AcrR family transcriptional regulator [Acidimicrobiales bacterium]
MSELTEKRNRETRSHIAETAVALFTEHGYDNTSMEQVAVGAGVSRRTVYRHFPTKDDLVFEHPRRWYETMEAVLATRGSDESSRDLIRRALLTVAATIEESAGPVLAAYAVLVATPTLGSRHSVSDALWMNRCVELMAGDLVAEPDPIFRAGIAAGALVGATNTVIAMWAAAQPDARIVPMTEAALDQIDSIWPAATRIRPPTPLQA